MTKSKKLLTCLLLGVLISAFSHISVQSAETREIIIDSVTAKKTGYCEIVGHYTNVPIKTQITCVVGSENLFDNYTIIEKNFNMDNLVHIDQVSTGNNGTFLIQFVVDKKWSEKTLVVKGGTLYGDNYTTTIQLPELPPGIEIVNNNSVLYGRDAYYVPGTYYTPNNIADSIAYGGNNVYFKIGDNWYNLMDEKAVDNSFLVKANATPSENIVALNPRYYYAMTNRIQLKYDLE